MKSIGARQCCQLSGKHRKDTGGTPVDSLRADHTTSFFYDSCVGGPRRPTTTYAYDKGNRVTQINDSVSGLITRTYDGLDRLIFESTPKGSITYTYDAADRRADYDEIGSARFEYRIEIDNAGAFERGDAELLHARRNECPYRSSGVCDADARLVRVRCERSGFARVFGSLISHAPPHLFLVAHPYR